MTGNDLHKVPSKVFIGEIQRDEKTNKFRAVTVKREPKFMTRVKSVQFFFGSAKLGFDLREISNKFSAFMAKNKTGTSGWGPRLV